MRKSNTVHPVEAMITTGYQTSHHHQLFQNDVGNHRTERRPNSSLRSGATVPIFHQTDHQIVELDTNKQNEVSKNAEGEEHPDYEEL